MRNFVKKYFFFDIDGTLTSYTKPGIISNRTKQALRNLENSGHMVVLATGRPYYFAKDIANEMGIKNLVCNGGNDVYINNTCIQHKPFDRALALQAMKECKAKQISFCVSYDDSSERISADATFEEAIKGDMFRGNIRIMPHLDVQQIPQIERLYIAITKADEGKLAFMKEYQTARYTSSYVILEPDDKYQGIVKLMQILDAPLDEIVVFGDGSNDIKMFQQAPFAIAMGNAVPRLKQIADFVTKTSDEDGIVYALQYFHWI